jgi:hypothetical protein
MLQTVEDAVARMNHLLSQLKAHAQQSRSRQVDPNVIVSTVVAGFRNGPALVATHNESEGCALAIEPERLKYALPISLRTRSKLLLQATA